ncbi:hypothetical protein D5086_021612 [Populus alba]|uniref:Uncharacterized protein n=1 Tax=Populus alba TaxID=43335 RepID=A0ACC4BCP4_POPAL
MFTEADINGETRPKSPGRKRTKIVETGHSGSRQSTTPKVVHISEEGDDAAVEPPKMQYLTRSRTIVTISLGSNRAKLIAQKLERGLGFGFWGLSWSVGWDYAINYAWRDFDYRNCTVLLREMNELLRFLGELTRSGSKLSEPLGLPGITKNVLRVAQSCYDGLSKCFINRVIKRRWCETVQREVVEGDLLRDCLELGSNDLKEPTILGKKCRKRSVVSFLHLLFFVVRRSELKDCPPEVSTSLFIVE